MVAVYEERPSIVPGAIVWRSISDGTPTRVLPDGCMDLLWDGRSVRIAGPDTRAELHAAPAGSVLTGLRFAPGHAPLLLATPAAELTDLDVPLDLAWSPSVVCTLIEQLSGADEAEAEADGAEANEETGAARDGGSGAPRPRQAVPGGAGRVLEQAALRRGRAVGADRSHRATAEVVRRLRRGDPVAEVADGMGLSARQLQRRSLDAFGYGPKLLARILRLGDALELARAGGRFAEVAATVGYADQAHLARDVRALAGVPLGQLV